MIIHDKLDEILRQGSKIKILRFLFVEKDEHTGRAIARAIGMSVSSTHKALREMMSEGLIGARKKGNAILYKIKEENYIVKELLGPLFEKERSLYQDMISLIIRYLAKQKRGIISMAIFGSVARGAETSKSDIDLVIVVENKIVKEKIDKAMDTLSVDMAKKFSVAISPYILTKIEIKRKYVKKQAIINAILENNRLIYGEPIERILA
ncbi:MAG: nucleotidyltransferase domain-containing protein [Candidatus Omnitrophica bacterium]|nr:nucleotidyltransferase domain-containing protein [Candidatus Omnitrophota bacterium]